MESLREALSHPDAYNHEPGTIEVVETHISWVFITGTFAFKVKKPVDLGFLDFSTLEKRLHCCREELRLNRRLCPEIYLSVVPIIRYGEHLLFDEDEKGEGEIIDYAVKMVRFDRTMELDRMMAAGKLRGEHIDTLSLLIARFHEGLAPAPPESGFGLPENVIKPVLHNFLHMEPVLDVTGEKERIEILKAWSLQEHQARHQLFLDRKRNGSIRQCHGDMHTGNMVLWREQILIFDCIEFSDMLSIIDVISDLAFLFMDLEHAGLTALAWRLLNGYLAETGDYCALPLLRFYAMYRAMVRAKVTAIRYSQTADPAAAAKSLEEHRSYLELAETYTLKKSPLLCITFGVSGSGKSHLLTALAPEIPAIHLRSDVERKRIAGLKPLQRSKQEGTLSIYTDEISRATYTRLLELAELCISEGIAVVVDATFLKRERRKAFMELAALRNTPFRILHVHAPETLLFERVQKRFREGSDPSEADSAVLKAQLASMEPLSAEEEAVSISIDSSQVTDIAAFAGQLRLLRS
ncbi:bifunctional aminoglycoside phosphotransferase/ATP-binding protein [Chlorobium ferrooxidans]|nr:bifunctional aminoglycoside phosphotransferase/ATP-binding protein [Chlorobium ferrooxidans]